MASIKKIENKNGESYKIVVCCGYDISGRKIVKTTTYRPDLTMTKTQQKKALEKYALEYENKVQNGECFDGEKLSFEEFTARWLEYKESNITYGSYENYQRLIKTIINPFFKGYKLAKIKAQLIEQFYISLKQKYAYASIKKCANILNGIFKTAIRWQVVTTNPCENALLPRNLNKKESLKFFTPNQSLIFLKSLELTFDIPHKAHKRIDDTGKPYYVNDYFEKLTVPTQYKVFYHISLYCGLRKSETLALHWNDIDFEKKEISITKTVSISEKGTIYKNPKTFSSIRIATMPEQLISLLKIYKQEYNTYRMEMGDAWQGEENLFTQTNGALMNGSTPYHYFKKHIKRYNEWVNANKEIAKEQGFEELPIIPLHGLRHSCATLLNYLDVNIIEIASMLGHAQTSTTMNIYAHSFEKQKHVASDKLEEFLRLNA